ncbi:hypothetical protein [Paenibacillus alkalitolerans]|uniref:hypothetical protein n=1 Tax=Paenibacillus alkalitolerans TaxID=2799335 RepID=UPI0018F2C19A|nr:hypothetical protein [Paenibacillus alkalitolerans]
MKSYMMKTVVVGVLIGAGVFFGIDLATSGIQRVHGTYENGRHVPVPAVKQLTAQQQAAAAVTETKPGPDPKAMKADATVTSAEEVTFINRLVIKLGEALQWAAKQAIRAVVSVFESMIH